MRSTGGETFGAIHPESVFTLELRQSLDDRLRAFTRGLQLDHGGEVWRLRATQVVAAAAVGNVAVTIDEAGKIFDHVGDQIVTPAGLQSHHREVGIPVVHLAKTPARHDIARVEAQMRIGAAWLL